MFLNSIGIINEFEEVLVDALVMTGEISALLSQEGIDPSTVNKLKIPSGLSRVGTFTMLCYLPPEWVIEDSDELWARVGPLKWKLSTNYRIKRIFANSKNSETGILNTLCVVSFDDWRYELNLNSSGSKQSLANVYQDDWRVYPSDVENTRTESEGAIPIVMGGLEREHLHLKVSDIPSLSDPWNAWDYKTKLSDAVMSDKILSSCGMVAVPKPYWCDEAVQYQGMPEWGTGGNPDAKYMVTEYIGDGWIGGIDSWNYYDKSYINGQLQCAFGNHEIDSTLDAEDDMEAHISEVPQDFSSALNWTAHPKDGSQEIPPGLDIQFPAKSEGGNIILYVFASVTHGMPWDYDNAFTYSNEIRTLTDHIKTKCTQEFEEGVLKEEGVTRIVIDPSNYEEVPGLSEERARELARRALHISRCFYARYFACTGVWETMGFNLMKPFSGMLELEYYLDAGVPKTRVLGSLNDNLFGFSSTDLTRNTVLSSGGVMLTRPDGMSDIALKGGTIGSVGVFPVQVEDLEMDSGGCLANYIVRNLTTDVLIAPVGGLTPWREIGQSSDPVCYAPAQIGSIGIMSVHPDYDPLNPKTNTLYFLILDEAVQTKSCA